MSPLPPIPIFFQKVRYTQRTEWVPASSARKYLVAFDGRPASEMMLACLADMGALHWKLGPGGEYLFSLNQVMDMHRGIQQIMARAENGETLQAVVDDLSKYDVWDAVLTLLNDAGSRRDWG